MAALAPPPPPPPPAAPLDADELLAAYEAERWAALVANGTHTAAEVALLRKRKRHKEECVLCSFMLRTRAWEGDPGLTARQVHLCYAAALDGLNRRPQAIAHLEEAHAALPDDTTVALGLAKLLFKADRKAEALERCEAVYLSAGTDAAAAADAYHLAGWIHIHSSDHSSAYEIWGRGHAACPDCPVLAKQHAKRACWDRAGDGDGDGDDDATASAALVGAGARADGGEVEAHSVAPGMADRTPALALFDPQRQGGRLVFRSNHALLTPAECAGVLDRVNAFHDARGGRWGTVRHSSVCTTDVAVEDIPELRPWLRTLLASRLYPMLAACFPVLSDGSSLIDDSTGLSRMRVHDAFIVRYDAEKDKSLSLPEHSDTSSMSFTLALNEKGADFEGGGTWFQALAERGAGRVVDADVGKAVAFAGPLRHAGFPVTSGTRVILVLFLYVDGFSYGQPLADFALGRGCDEVEAAAQGVSPDAAGAKPSGDAPGGFVVYNQTVELVEMLEREVESVIGGE